MIIEKKNCGNCSFASTVPQDLKIRVCKGGPPQAVLMANGLQFVYPIVQPENAPCGFHKLKSLLDTPAGSA